MTQETFEKLTKYRNYLYTAYYANYTRSLTNFQVEELISIASEIGIVYRNNHCPKCLLEFLQKLGKAFFEYKVEEDNMPKKQGRKTKK